MKRIPTLSLGAFRVQWLRGGRFRLDGGAMFGPVPKPLWGRRYPSDKSNSIAMQASPLLVTTENARLLIDTGLGDKLDDRQRRIYRLEEEPAVIEDLTAVGLAAEDIDYVIMTHMDWDHSSGGTMRTDGGLAPTFPRARYIVQQAEWDACTNPTSRTRHGYWEENWRPLLDAGRVELVDGDVEVVPGVRLHLTGGHTHGHQIVHIDGGQGEKGDATGTTMLLMGDIMPTHAHVNPLWVMGYDNFPLTSIEQKERWLPKAQAGRWRLSFYHDPYLLAATLDEDGNMGDNLAGTLGWPPPTVGD